MKHWIVWNPDEEFAYRGATATEAKDLARRHARQGAQAKWLQLVVDGWLLSEVEGPDPAPVPEPVAPVRKAKAR